MGFKIFSEIFKRILEGIFKSLPVVVFESRVDSSSRRARLSNDPMVDFSGAGELHR